MSVKISVIIPVYKKEKYFSMCLDSVLNQTLKDIEIICVTEILEEGTSTAYIEQLRTDERITLLQQNEQNIGLGRNAGLKQASGKYVMFLTGDECFESNVLELMYEKAEKESADICICEENINRNDCLERIFMYTSPELQNKLFRREFILDNQLKFLSQLQGDGIYFTFLALACADKVTAVSQCLVKYASGYANSDLKLDILLETLVELRRELIGRKKYKSVGKDFVNYSLGKCLDFLDEQNEFKTFNEICLKLKNEVFYSLGILGHTGNYFYSKTNFQRMLKIMDSVPDESWMKKRGAGKSLAEIEDFSSWKPDKEEVMWGKAKISVIMPVYNVQNYLEEALESIINQSLKEIEILCVDDGSTDDSLNILKKIGDLDPRIKVFSKKNAGASSARNYGLKRATGKYIYFMDSDDILESNALEICFNKAEKYNLDMVIFSTEPFFEKEDFQENIRKDYYSRYSDYSGELSGREFFMKAVSEAELKPAVWLYLLKREIITANKISFYEGIIQEDNLFTIECLLLAQSVKYINAYFHKRRVRENSVMTGSTTIYHAYSYYIVMRELEKFAEKENLKSDKEVYSALLTQILRTRNYLCGILADIDPKKMREEAEQLPYGIGFYFFMCDAVGQRRALSWTQSVWENEKSRKYKLEFDLKAEREQLERIKTENLDLKKKNEANTEENNNLRIQNADLIKHKKILEEKNAKLISSQTYKIGRMILFIPRKIKKVIERIRK